MATFREVIRINIKIWCVAILLCFLLGVIITLIYPPWSLLASLLVVQDRLTKVDVLVTLGGDSERELYAAELYRQGLAPKIIMSGCGSSASKMAKRAVKTGVNAGDVILEERAESTYENALYSKNIISAQDFKSAIIVSSPYHMRRTKLVFERVFKNTGVKLLYSPTKDSGFNVDGLCKSERDRAIVKREYIKLIYYWFRYW